MAERDRGSGLRGAVNSDGQAQPLPGLVTALIGLVVLLSSFSIDVTSLPSKTDPGPRLFPMGLGVFLLLLGLVDAWMGMRHGRGERTAGRGLRRPGVLMAALAGYAALLPVLGFACSTLLFSFGVMWWMGRAWKLAALGSVLLVGAVLGLFVQVFKVALPSGMLGFPF